MTFNQTVHVPHAGISLLHVHVHVLVHVHACAQNKHAFVHVLVVYTGEDSQEMGNAEDTEKGENA